MARPQREVLPIGRNLELMEEFVKSPGVLSARRVRKYRYRLGRVSRVLGVPFEEVGR